ncbi:hypothetical protein F2P81_008386 [Scophthalmus maximus]|uniref:Uncharacterized protein n=1 Tax=Scophthalmus maximus TaxID=52904 RepID=A0A6A4TB48_SCOMX|nr:hypothetical protein F2P81_008386 [Scophthalmus maximus]
MTGHRETTEEERGRDASPSGSPARLHRRQCWIEDLLSMDFLPRIRADTRRTALLPNSLIIFEKWKHERLTESRWKCRQSSVLPCSGSSSSSVTTSS